MAFLHVVDQKVRKEKLSKVFANSKSKSMTEVKLLLQQRKKQAERTKKRQKTYYIKHRKTWNKKNHRSFS